MEHRRPAASDVVRATEVELARAAALRAEAMRLAALADETEAAALDGAVAALGEVRGRAAYDLAEGSIPEAPAELAGFIQALVPVAASAEPATVPPSVLPAAAEPATVASPATAPAAATHVSRQVPAVAPPASATAASEAPHAAAPGRPTMHGIVVPAGREQDAEDVVRQAAAAAAQRKKTNPFLGDRGKNAWRKALFAAALDALSRRAAEPPAEPAPPPKADVPAESPADALSGPLAETGGAPGSAEAPDASVAGESASVDVDGVAAAAPAADGGPMTAAARPGDPAGQPHGVALPVPVPVAAGPEREPEPVPEQVAETEPEPDPPPQATPAPAAPPAHDPLDDLPAPGKGKEPFVRVPGYGQPRPLPPGHRLGFGNPVPKPDTLDQALAAHAAREAAAAGLPPPPPPDPPRPPPAAPPPHRRLGSRPAFLPR